MGLSQKILFHCDNQTVVDIWDKASTYVTQTMALGYCISVLYIITSMYA